MTITLFLYLLSLTFWLGGMTFFAFFVAPALFGNLQIAEAGKVVSAIFPRYYMLGYVAGVISVILAAYFAIFRTPHGVWTLTALLLAGALALTIYAGAVVRPQVDAIRTVAEEANPDPVRKAEFDRLHRLSVQLNGAVMILDLLALLATASALAPRL
jgi:uncharacterized membrane protein